MDDYVFDESKALKFWSRYGNNQTGWCDINGHDQRVKGLVSSWDADADYSEKGNYLGSRGGGAATLYLVGAQEDCLFRGLVTNEVSVVWAPQGDYVQTFSNRVHETTGRLVVSNGTMRIAGTATFAKVPEIVVAPGASFECLTTASGALSSLRRLVIGDGAVFTVGGTTPKPFADGRLELVVRGSGRLVLPAGMNVTAKTTSVDGVLPAAGVYGAEQSWLDGGTVDVGNVDVTCWRSAVSGRWHDAANWSAGVPTASSVAVISADGADYTVVVDADADLGRELRVSNAGEGAAKLSIAADAVMTNGFIAVGDGGTVEIASTGSLSYEGKGGGVRTAAESEDVVVIVGGRFVVDGGQAEFRHMCGRMCVRGGETESGRVEVREGAFRHLQDRWGDYLRVEEGGEIEVSGGEMTFDSPADVATVGFRLFGGSLSVTGGVFGVGEATDNADMRLHDGIAVFGGDGVLQLDDKYETKLRLENFDVDDDLKVRFEGRSRIAPADFKIFHGGGTSAGVVEVDWCSSEFSGESAHVFRAMVGNQSGGSVKLNVSDSVFRAGSDGVFVAFNRAASWPSAVQKGFLNVGNNGRLIVEGFGAAVSGYSSWQLMGLNVGYSGYAGSNGSDRPCRYPFEGEMTVSSGGSADVLYGDVGIGVGYATGRLTVDGGALSVNDHDGNSTSYDYENRTFAIGLFGGVGECVVKNGATLSCRTDLFVGGAETNRYPYQSSGIVSTSCLPMDHSATGTLTVADADVALDGSLVLGQDGFAVLRRVGSEGAFTAGDLVCTNVADAAHTGSRIEFAADAEGFGTIDVDGSVTIGENAKLSVDLSAYTGGRRNFRLLGCASRQGDFAEMTVVGVREDLAPVRFEWTAHGLYLKMRRDLTVILR